MEETLYTVKQVAIILKVHPLTIRRYIKDSKLKAIKAAGNIRVSKAAIDEFTQNIYPTSYGVKETTRVEKYRAFSLEDPIFRLKGRGMSFKGSK